MLAWAFYDWANSAFATTVMAGFFPVFFKQYWNAGVVATESTFRLGVTSGLTSLLVALLAPVLGAIADRSNSRVRLLMLVTVLGAAATAALALVGQGHWVAAAGLYFAASLGFWGGIVFNDSLLLHVAEPDEYDLVSGFGYALGYLGGGLLFAVNVLMTQKPAWFGLPDAAAAVRASFLMVGAWWLVFALPCFFFVREKNIARDPDAGPCGAPGLRGTAQHARPRSGAISRSSGSSPPTGSTSTASTRSSRWPWTTGSRSGSRRRSSIAALLLTQFVAFPAALAFGWIGRRIGPRKGIFIALAVYAAATVLRVFHPERA